jgi:DeoR family fructose operon transcriptional repressor
MDKMFNLERKSEILRLLEQNGRIGVNELSTLFNASRETIRRDLRQMEARSLLQRTHGGAVLTTAASSVSHEFPLGVREIQRFREKNAICQCAASYVTDGDSVFVDNSSTCIYLIKYLPRDLQITLITNSIKLLTEAMESDHPNLMIICLGGFFHRSNLSTYGAIAQKNAADFYPNKSFLSCAGIQPPNQLMDSSILEVDTKRLMIDRSQEVFILADHTKFDNTGPFFLSNFSSIDYVITDAETLLSQSASLERAGVKVVRTRDDYGTPAIS